MSAGSLTTRQGVVLQYVGIVALLIAGLQPVILGGLAGQGRLTVGQIGMAATGELLALGIACGLAAAFLKPVAMRTKLVVACLGHALCNLGSLSLSGGELIALRGLTGLFAGVMLWSTIGMIARSARPERQSGVFVTSQTLAQLVLAALLPMTVMVQAGVNGALACLAAISVTAAVAALWAPSTLRPLPKAEGRRASITPLAWGGLAAVFLYMAFIVAVWVYLEPLALRVGLTTAQAQGAVAVALAMQVLGGATATLLGGRLTPALVLVGAATINLALLAALAASPTAPMFIGLVAVFGFLWLFVLPFHTALLVRIDPTRHAAMQLGSAQLLGSSAGPLAASLLVGDSNVGGALQLAGVCLVMSLSLILIVTTRLRRSIAELPAG